MQITIMNWEKFNPRTDVKNPSWFRFEYKVLFDPDWQDFAGEELMVWVTLLSMRCFKNKSEFFLTERQISSLSRVKIDSVVTAIKKLQELRCISINTDVHDTSRNVTTRARENPCSTDETYITRRDETPQLRHPVRDDTSFHKKTEGRVVFEGGRPPSPPTKQVPQKKLSVDLSEEEFLAEYLPMKFHQDFLKAEFLSMRVYCEDKGRTITKNFAKSWMNRDWCKDRWEKFQIKNKLKPDPLISYLAWFQAEMDSGDPERIKRAQDGHYDKT